MHEEGNIKQARHTKKKEITIQQRPHNKKKEPYSTGRYPQTGTTQQTTTYSVANPFNT